MGILGIMDEAPDNILGIMDDPPIHNILKIMDGYLRKYGWAPIDNILGIMDERAIDNSWIL